LKEHSTLVDGNFPAFQPEEDYSHNTNSRAIASKVTVDEYQ